MGTLSFPLSFAAPDQLPSYTFAQMKALTGMSDGQMVRVSNYGRGGSTWRYSATLTDWFPVAPTKIYENTALISGVAQLAAQILLAIPVEAGLLTGKVFRALVTTAKSGTTDTVTTVLRMGNAGTTADATVQTLTALAGTNRSIGTDTWQRMASVTSAERLGGSPAGSFSNQSTGGVVSAAVTVATVAAANFISVGCTSNGTTDTPQLAYVAIEIQP